MDYSEEKCKCGHRRDYHGRVTGNCLQPSKPLCECTGFEKAPNAVTFTLPALPPSVNSLYQIIYSQRRVELKPEARAWKTQAKEYMPPWRAQGEATAISIQAHFMCPRYYANGKPRIYDVANLLKLLIDAVADRYGFNDARVWSGSWSSEDSAREGVRVTVAEIQP